MFIDVCATYVNFVWDVLLLNITMVSQDGFAGLVVCLCGEGVRWSAEMFVYDSSWMKGILQALGLKRTR